MGNMPITLEAGMGFAVLAGYVLFKLKRIKKFLRKTILRRAS